MAQLSDDCFAHGGRLMRLDEALELLARAIAPVAEPVAVPLAQALGRVLAEDIVAGHDVPPGDNSAVDGYAIAFDDLAADRETPLPIAGRAAAGHPSPHALARGAAIRIFTGAPMPEGADTVMMQEDCRVEDGHVVIPPGIKRGANRRRRGEDFHTGDTVLRRGVRLRPQDIGQAAAVGRRAVTVARPLRVALFSTGDELREPGGALEPGAIYDSNRHALSALLSGLGCVVDDLGILRDREPVIREALAAAACDHDVLITSGGVSVGEEDHVKHAVEAQGRLHLWRLAIKPGRPIALGQVGHVPFVGLPGNPVAVMVTFIALVRPLLLRLMGAQALAPRRFKVRTGFAYKKKKDRREWVRVWLEPDDDEAGFGWRAVKFPRDGAGILSSLVASDGLVELPEELTHLEPGSVVDYLPFSEVFS